MQARILDQHWQERKASVIVCQAAGKASTKLDNAVTQLVNSFQIAQHCAYVSGSQSGGRAS